MDLVEGPTEAEHHVVCRLLRDMRLESIGCELSDQVTISAMPVSNCKQIAIAVLVVLDKILVLIRLVRIIRVVAFSRPMAPSQHFLRPH